MDSTTRPDDDARREPGRPSEPEAGRRLFDRLRATGLQRPEEGWIGGVMALVARRLRWDPTLVRGLGVLAALLFFSPMLLLYGLAWILLPDHRERIPAQRAIRGDVTGGFVVGALLAVLGALNVITPLNLAGPFAVLANVVIIAVVVALVVATTRGRRGHRGRRSRRSDDAGDAADPQGGDAAGKARAGRSSPAREDGRPAWFPKDSAPSADAAGPADPAQTASTGAAAPAPATDDARRPGGCHEAAAPSARSLREREAERRRRRVTLGLVLLVVPGLILLGLAGDALGFPGSALVLAGLIGIVALLAVGHLVAALRGRRGRGGLLVLATAAMLLVFAVHQGAADAPRSDGAYRAFSNSITEEDALNAAFSNSTMDLRHLQGEEGTVEASLNTAFASNDVVVPDGAAVVLESRQALGSLAVEMQDDERRIAGLDAGEHRFGPADASLEIRLTVQSAFGSTTLYDASSYAAADPEAAAAPRPDGEVTL